MIKMGKWRKIREIRRKIKIGANERTTYPQRYIHLQKFVARSLRRANSGEVTILDLGCGIIRNKSPVAEDFMKLLKSNNVPLKAYIAVDKHAKNYASGGISYKRRDVLEFIRKSNLAPNVIVASRILEHLERFNPPIAKEFLELCWQKLAERGFLITEAHLFGKYISRRYASPFSDRKPLTLMVPLVVQKIEGKPNVGYMKLFDYGFRTDIEKFTPSKYKINV